jgi:hypothetical protein
MALKSILKKSVEEVTSHSSTAAKSGDERNKEIALYHANLIQAQKDVEAAIVDAIETLIDYPVSPDSTSSAPTASDVIEFTKLIYLFTPSDYDELIEERRIDNKCGYVFCVNAPKKTPGGKLKIVGMQVMDRGKAESWCSKECARRTLFVKVQLMEEPAWSRRAATAPQLEILTGKMEAEQAVKEKLREDQEDMEGAMRALALERGDEDKPARAVGMIADTLVERDVVKAPTAPLQNGDNRDAIEGYAPNVKSSRKLGKELGDVELDI